eukprot:TRINITY_DN18382_c0_g6_i1.p1 TRINITY_DN18382_c0_g6~~TRINITY_DN18382_c0_g6_i1.p1  ORF type:complete len:241 (+),score=27.16 TRINITY_DN18382_c0_g6_i1:119-841(+)
MAGCSEEDGDLTHTVVVVRYVHPKFTREDVLTSILELGFPRKCIKFFSMPSYRHSGNIEHRGYCYVGFETQLLARLFIERASKGCSIKARKGSPHVDVQLAFDECSYIDGQAQYQRRSGHTSGKCPRNGPAFEIEHQHQALHASGGEVQRGSSFEFGPPHEPKQCVHSDTVGDASVEGTPFGFAGRSAQVAGRGVGPIPTKAHHAMELHSDFLAEETFEETWSTFHFMGEPFIVLGRLSL